MLKSLCQVRRVRTHTHTHTLNCAITTGSAQDILHLEHAAWMFVGTVIKPKSSHLIIKLNYICGSNCMGFCECI